MLIERRLLRSGVPLSCCSAGQRDLRLDILGGLPGPEGDHLTCTSSGSGNASTGNSRYA